MSGYINRGTDARILGRVGGWVQSKLSFHSDTPPRGVTVVGERDTGHLALTWPPFLSIAIPLKGRYATFRAGWRWDPNWGRGGYIADVIIKLRMDHVVEPY